MSKELKAPDKVTQKMTRDGAVAENLTTGETSSISERPQEENYSAPAGVAAEKVVQHIGAEIERHAAKGAEKKALDATQPKTHSSRLQFSEAERATPELQKAIKKSDKAADCLDAARAAIPKQTKIKKERVFDEAKGKAKTRLSFEKTDKPPNGKLRHNPLSRPAQELNSTVHGKIYEVEKENVGVESGHRVELAGEKAGGMAARAVKGGIRRHKLKPYRAAAAAEKQAVKANADFLYQKALHDNPALAHSNPISRFWQKQRIKKQYAKTLKAGGKAKKTAEATAKAAKKTAEATKTLTVAVFNHPPVVTPVSSLKGASMSNGQTYTFASSASDKEDGDLSPAILWVSSQSGFLGKGAAIQTVLQPGVHVLTAKATDKGGKTAVVTKTMSVESVNLLPSVQILQVSPGAAGSQGQLHELTGAALDEEDGNLTHTLAWSSNLDGNLGEGSPVVASLRTGTHTLTARACDKRGGCFSVSRSVTVVPFNHPPSVEIVSVVGSRQDTKGQAFELRGKATDKEEGGLSGKIVWTSNRDGRLGQAEAIKPRLSHGTHTITAKVKDSKGKESSKTVTVTSFKTPRLELTVSTKRIFSLRQVKTSWKGGSSGVEIFRDGVKVETGPNQGTRYYWLRKKAAITVCDTLNPAVSVTRTTK